MGNRVSKSELKVPTIDGSKIPRTLREIDSGECDLAQWLHWMRMLGKGKHGSTGEFCMVKDYSKQTRNCQEPFVIKRSALKQAGAVDEYLNEVAFLQKLTGELQRSGAKPRDWPFPIYYGAFRCDNVKSDDIKLLYTVDYGYIGMSKGGVTFGSMIKWYKWQQRRPSKPTWKRWFRNVLEAIQDLESLKINHNDLHTENVMFKGSDPKDDIVLIDFGWASQQNWYGTKSRKQTGKFGSGYDAFMFLEDVFERYVEMMPDSIERWVSRVVSQGNADYQRIKRGRGTAAEDPVEIESMKPTLLLGRLERL